MWLKVSEVRIVTKALWLVAMGVRAECGCVGSECVFLRVVQGMRHVGGSFAVEIKKTQDYDS